MIEINGVPYTEFKNEKAANDLFEKMVLEIVPGDGDEDSDDDSSEEE